MTNSKIPHKIICYHCSEENKYSIKNLQKLPKRPKKDCKKCKKTIYLKFEFDNGQIKVKPVKEPQGHIFNPSTMTNGSPKGGISTSPLLDPNYYSNINIKTLLKNSAIQEVINNLKHKAKAWDILMNDEFIQQGEIVSNIYWTSDTPPYKRPTFLYPQQTQAMGLMEFAHLLWQASRQLAGKTTATFLKDFEDMLENPNTVIGLVAPTVPLAVEVLFKFLYDPLKKVPGKPRFYDLLEPYFLKEPNQLGFALKNRSRLNIISLNIAGSQGRSLDVLHIEEIDKLGTEQSKRLALAGIINSVRANPEAKIRINCNNATGIFRLLRAELFKYGMYFPIFLEDVFEPGKYTGRHTIINEDAIPEKEPALDDFLSIFSQVLVSFAFAEGQLYNIDNVTDETFNPDKVEIAYNTPYDREDYFIKTKMGIDPGGKVDAFGVTVWSLTYSGKVVLRWAKRFYNALHTAKEQAKEIAKHYILFNVEEIQSESSAGAPWSLSLIADEVNIQSAGKIKCRFEYVNFEGPGKMLAKDNFVYLFKILLDYEYLILFERNDEERALHHQITKYIPNKSESSNNPDDLVESGFHGIWRLLGGMRYIKEITERQEALIGITTQE